ncbi:MAG: MFS transporter, partial [Pseudomonadota bacterium]|nr:MFS transporter [Pseudomonadota bacterium]
MSQTATKPFFGWCVLAATAYCLMIGSGLIFYAMSVFLENIVRETGFSVAKVSAANTLFLFSSGLAGIAVGELISRFDIRYTIATGTLAMAAAFFAIPSMQNLTHLYALYIALGVGYAMTALVPATTLAARWFVRRRALALALTQSGLSLGGILLTPMLAELMGAGGLAAVRSPFTIILILLMLPISLFFMRPDPASMGLNPDGDARTGYDTNPRNDGIEAARAVRSRFFLLSAFASLFALLTQVGAIAHIYSWALERATPETATISVSLLAGCSFISRLICGSFLDRISLYPFVLTLYFLQGLAMVVIAFASGEPVVKGVACDVWAGATTCIVGESGSGKTLTSLAVMGLLPGT